MNFFAKMLLKKQLKGVPGAGEVEIERLLGIVEKNPEFFARIAEEVKKKVDAGIGHQEAVMAVLAEQENRDEISKIVEAE